MLMVVNSSAIVLALSWACVSYFSIFKQTLSPRFTLFYILSSSVAISFALYIIQTQDALGRSAQNVSPAALIPAYAQLGFIGVKGVIFLSVFSLVALKKNQDLSNRALAVLSIVSLFTVAFFGLNFFP